MPVQFRDLLLHPVALAVRHRQLALRFLELQGVDRFGPQHQFGTPGVALLR